MTTLLTAFLILVPAPAPDEEPVGPIPSVQYLKWNKGAFETTVTVTEYSTRTEAIIVNVNGKQMAETRTVVVPVAVVKKMMLDGKGAEVFGLDGKRIDEATWQKVLSAGAVVVVTRDGQLPHAAYRKVFREGTLIVVFKPIAPTSGPMTAPSSSVPKP